MTAADRFRGAAERGDADAMAEALAADAKLRSPTLWPPVEGRERARMIFRILAQLFEEFEYTHDLAGAPLVDSGGIAATRALVFRCRIGGEVIEGVDEIAVLTVFVRPLAGVQVLSDAVAARLRAGRAPSA